MVWSRDGDTRPSPANHHAQGGQRHAEVGRGEAEVAEVHGNVADDADQPGDDVHRGIQRKADPEDDREHADAGAHLLEQVSRQRGEAWGLAGCQVGLQQGDLLVHAEVPVGVGAWG